MRLYYKVRYVFKVTVFLFFVNLTYGLCQNSPFEYKNVPSTYMKNITSLDNGQLITGNGFYDATKKLPSNFVTDGSVDYTIYIQKALKENRKVKLPNFPILINNHGLNMSSNSVLLFQENSSLILKESDASSYGMIHLNNVENVEIINVNLVGDRKNRGGRKGQWGMGISVRSSKNIKIRKGKIVDCWGDGIYLGQDKNTNTNILIEGLFINNCRRNGISVISANGLSLFNCLIANTYGHNPMAGIDIEPNSAANTIKDINIQNIITFNNKNYGIVVSLDKLLAGESSSYVNITVDNHIDELANTGFLGVLGSKVKSNKKSLSGYLKVQNSLWKSNLLYPFRLPLTYNNGIEVSIKNSKNINLKGKSVDLQKLNNRYEHYKVLK